jgi:hypothetical protein
MSDSMAIEELAANYLKLLGYVTEIRIPCLNKYTREGEKKRDKQGTDIDVIGRSPSNKLVAVEVKGYGMVDTYDNWCKRDYIETIHYLIDKLHNTQQIRLKAWNKIFEKKRKKFDEIWVVIPGYFEPSQEIAKIDGRKQHFDTEFMNGCIDALNKMQSSENEHSERDYVQYYERRLTKHFRVKCRIIPIHELIEELMLEVTKDSYVRRTRYPDTALETFRWMARAVSQNRLDLQKIQEKISAYRSKIINR